MAEFLVELQMAAAATEAFLDGALSEANPAVPERLTAAMRHAALGAGKRLRPFLVIEAARLLGLTGDGPVRAGAALECVHCYSLVHDDLPAMDDDDLRRGKPTVHRAFDEATAILAGDALLTMAFEILADPATDPDARIRVALVAGLAEAAGAAGMVGGQQLDLAAENQSLADSDIAALQAMKTGALFRFACEAGAIMGRASAEKRQRLADFGSAFGAIFQLADDLIDATGNPLSAGKKTGKDAGRGKATFVARHGVSEARALLRRQTDEAIALLSPFGKEGKVLSDAVRFAGRRDA
jgi:farnesyl diphosphate synthase